MGYELIEIDQATGEEELVGYGSMEELSSRAAEKVEQAEDDGYDTPRLRIQPKQ